MHQKRHQKQTAFQIGHEEVADMTVLRPPWRLGAVRNLERSIIQCSVTLTGKPRFRFGNLTKNARLGMGNRRVWSTAACRFV